MSRRLSVIAPLALSAAVAFAQPSPPPAASTTTPALPPAATGVPAPSPIAPAPRPAPAQSTDFDCIIEARQTVDIRSPVEGLIEKVAVERGEFVKKGQIVVTLESGPERAAVAIAKSKAEQQGAVKAAEARLDLARKKEIRAEELARQNFISPNALEEARTERSLAESELKVARENQKLAELEVQRAAELLNMRTIRSPVNGVVVDRYIKAGEFATTNVKDPILKIAEVDPLNVEVILPARLFGDIKRGTKAEVTPETPPRKFIATVAVVDQVMNAAAGTFGVRLELRNPNLEVPAGARCRVRFLN
ncbi:MAG: efflux RND transporter periplasmic adaptor subunit [Burkholderiales bacterium]|nr:efflux RND transporter periplasmic adaptor subunit [Burkholderiales bacterium]